MKFDEPIAVIHLDSFDRDLIVIDKNVENVFTASFRDGVCHGRSNSTYGALMDLSNILQDLSRKVKDEAQDYRYTSWNQDQMKAMMNLYDLCDDDGTFMFEGNTYTKKGAAEIVQMMGRTMRNGQ